MIPEKTLRLLEEHPDVTEFVKDTDDYDILVKELKTDELIRLNKEFPKLFRFSESFLQKKENIPKIIGITLVKRDADKNNYIQLKKIKLYFDETNEKIIKTLKN